jgi:hypothetical protein
LCLGKLGDCSSLIVNLLSCSVSSSSRCDGEGMPNFTGLLDESCSFWFVNKDGLIEVGEGFDNEAMIEARHNFVSSTKGKFLFGPKKKTDFSFL